MDIVIMMKIKDDSKQQEEAEAEGFRKSVSMTYRSTGACFNLVSDQRISK